MLYLSNDQYVIIGGTFDMIKAHKYMKRFTAISMIIALIAVMMIPIVVQAEEAERKVVRVGWFESSYNFIDENGRRSGYSYEYQLKLSDYNGWTYEYVKGSWSDLMQKLINGEIDLMSDVSYTEERSELMLFPNLPMGTEEYFLFCTPDNKTISASDFSTLNGKKVGVNKASFQEQLYKDWAEENNVNAELIEVSTVEEESLEMLNNGELDAYVTVDSFMDPTEAVPLYKIGSSDFFFAVNKNRPDLLSDLNHAMSRIQDENRFYNMELYEKFLRDTGANIGLTEQETEWLESHGTIKVGYHDKFLPFCTADKETGDLTGVLKDYLDLASDCITNVHIDFEATPYPTISDALEAVRNGEIDCMFPSIISGYEAEKEGVALTPSILETQVYALVRSSEPNLFEKEGQIIAAVPEGETNYESLLAEYYPTWGRVYCKDIESCLKAVSERKADCFLLSNYRYNNLSRLCEKLRLAPISLGLEKDFRFAVKRGNIELSFILAKTAVIVPASSVNASVARYMTEDSKLDVWDFLSDNIYVVILIASLILFVILVLLIMNIRAYKRAKSLISATETDDLTGLYNRKFFFQYADRMYHDHPDTPMDAFVLNIEQFHSVNALHGRELGDRILRTLGNGLHDLAAENDGIAGRFEADRFDVYCRHVEDYRKAFNKLQASLDEVAPNANIRLRMGVMPWQKGLEPVQLVDRARTACKMARGHYQEPLIVYDEKVSNREGYEQRLVNDLRRALENHEFEIFYQPKFDIQSEPAKLVSAEALVRWRHPELGLIPPFDFIPLFERNGQIGLLDRYVWAHAAEQIAAWKKKYGADISVSVNLSRVDVFDPDLVDTLEDILVRNDLDHSTVHLEVTESAYTENSDQVIRVVETLRDKGYKIEMDDFGTGYSSLNMLSDMPIDLLKMDRGFIRNIEHEEKDIQLVALILDIAKNLNVPVIAEGVETEEQIRLLKGLGCAMVQGYYFSKPLPADEFEKKYFIK